MTERLAASAKNARAPEKQRGTARAGRPATPLITRLAAADAALRLIDQNGLEALSLQSVARALGVSAPSLYHHFRDKDELLAKVARRMLEEVGAEQDHWSENWEKRIIELSLATRRVMLRHPSAASLMLRYFPRQVMLTAYENSLADCPYPVENHLVISELVEKVTYGSALFAAAAETHHIPAMPPVDPEHYPHLARAIAAAPGEEDVFVEGLRVLLDGLRVRFGGRPALAAE